jgi:hypothetical protein
MIKVSSLISTGLSSKRVFLLATVRSQYEYSKEVPGLFK